ncbi:hypothetical protein DFJ73DRAFT_15261 [Zopfochytrium polystomum]|nr:hypothetical protein DFJ73DRAFT_15261 [Zopfochytrium polystomum]
MGKISTTLCAICRQSPAKYRCPGCSAESCSLACTKQHKANAPCTGVRDRTAHVRMSQYSEQTMMSDYCFLEDAHRLADNAERENSRLHEKYGRANPAPADGGRPHPHQRGFVGVGGRIAGPPSHPQRPTRLSILQRQCGFRGMAFHSMPAGMKRHQENRSIFQHKSKSIYWTVEWVFSDSNITIIDHMIPEKLTVKEAVDRVTSISKPENADNISKLSVYFAGRNLDQCFFYLRKEMIPATSPCHIPIPTVGTTSLRSLLENKTIVEYPTILVFTAPLDPSKVAALPREETVVVAVDTDGTAPHRAPLSDSERAGAPENDETETAVPVSGVLEGVGEADATGNVSPAEASVAV